MRSPQGSRGRPPPSTYHMVGMQIGKSSRHLAEVVLGHGLGEVAVGGERPRHYQRPRLAVFHH